MNGEKKRKTPVKAAGLSATHKEFRIPKKKPNISAGKSSNLVAVNVKFGLYGTLDKFLNLKT